MNTTKDTQPTNRLLNAMRAAVLGANDGIVSTASVAMGVAGATTDDRAIMTAGFAALIAGALSMAVGEYVSVSSQSDAEKAFIAREKAMLASDPEGQLRELAHEYEKHGISSKQAAQIAQELTAKDPLKAHLRMHFGIDPDDVNSPTQAAVASLVAFTAGGLVPFLAVVFAPSEHRIWMTMIAVVIALFATGYLSATAGNASRTRAVLRVVIGGVIAMVATYYIGVLFGVATA